MKKITVRTVIMATVVCLWLSLWFTFKPPAEVQAATNVTVSTFDELVAYCSMLGDYVITLGANITVTGKIAVENGSKTIKGNGKKLTGASGEPVFEIKRGAAIITENITIDRSSVPTHNIFYGHQGSNIIINSGVYIAGNVETKVGVSCVNAFGGCTINGGYFSGSYSKFYGIALNGEYDYVINGGYFHDCTTAVGIKQIDMEGDEPLAAVEWNKGAAFKQTLTVNGGNFYNNQNNGLTCGNVNVDQPGKSDLIINGGNFYGNGLHGISIADERSEVQISGANCYQNENSGILVHGATLKFTSSSTENIKIYGNKTNIHISGTTASFIGKNATLKTAPTGVYVINGATATLGTGMLITDHTSYGVNSSSSNLILEGAFVNRNKNGIRSYSGSCTVKNASVNNNTETGLTALGDAFVTINNITTTGNKTGIYISSGTLKLSGGNISSNTDTGVMLVSGVDAVVSGGTMDGNKDGIYVDTKAALKMTGGSCKENTNSGISIFGLSTVTLGCIVLENNAVYGIYVSGCEVKLNKTTVSASNKGVYLTNASSMTLTGAKIEKNTSDGIQVMSGSTVTLSSATKVQQNGENGVYAGENSQINVNGGIVSQNKYGITGYSSKLILDEALVISDNTYCGVTGSQCIVEITNVSIYGNVSYGIVVQKQSDVTLNSVVLNAGTGGQKIGLYADTAKKIYANNLKITSHTSDGINIKNTTDVTINDGNFSENKNGLVMQSSKVLLNGAVKVADNMSCGIYSLDGKLTVNGGILNGNNYGVKEENSKVVLDSVSIINNNHGGIHGTDGDIIVDGESSVCGNGTNGIYVKGNANLTLNKGNVIGSSGQDTGIYMDSTGTAVIGSANVKENRIGILHKKGTLVIKGATISQNTEQGAKITYNESSPHFVMESGNITKNGKQGIYVYGTSGPAQVTIKGGTISENLAYGIDAREQGQVNISGGNITNNKGVYGEVYDAVTGFILTGTYNGRSSVNGYVYLANDNNYVTTKDSTTTIKVRPAEYVSGRVVIHTNSEEKAKIQEEGTLYPYDDWMMKKVGVDVVLSRMPGIFYKNELITSELVLPSTEGWFNAVTINSIGEFSAKDEDGDLVTFELLFSSDNSKAAEGNGNGSLKIINHKFTKEGIISYILVAKDSLGNTVTRNVKVRADMTPPLLIDYSGSETDYGKSGTGDIFSWSVVVVNPDVSFTQQGQDVLSGVASISMFLYSDQSSLVKRNFSSPFTLVSKLNTYPEEKGLIFKCMDKAGNECYKCVLNDEMLDIKAHPFFPKN